MRINSIKMSTLLCLFFATISVSNSSAQERSSLEGRWDIIIKDPARKKEWPSWLEVHKSGDYALVGRFVFAVGSARPVSEIKFNEGNFSFSIPSQWKGFEGLNSTLDIEGSIKGDSLQGVAHLAFNNTSLNFVASRAPLLHHVMNPVWGKPIKIFNDKDLTGWHTTGDNQWVVESGVLKSPKRGSNLITDQTFMDFKLHIEFRYQKDGNSGIYLRGRYEVQIADNKGLEPSNIYYGGVYGFLEPNEMAAKDAGEWQSYDITFIGRRVTIVANGLTVINDQVIPGITGGALNSKEGEPGPIMLQGDHDPIEFRNIVITPAK